MGRDVAVTLLSGELAAAALNNPLSQFSSSPFSMALPYYDLAVSHTLLEAQTQRERVSQAIKLGWDAVALVHQAAAKLGEQQDRCVPLQAHFGQRGRLPPPSPAVQDPSRFLACPYRHMPDIVILVAHPQQEH